MLRDSPSSARVNTKTTEETDSLVYLEKAKSSFVCLAQLLKLRDRTGQKTVRNRQPGEAVQGRKGLL